MYFLLAY